MIDLLPAIFVIGLAAVAAAAFAAGNRISDDDTGHLGRMFALFRARRAQYNQRGWRAMIVARTFSLVALVLLIVQVLSAVRADQSTH